MPSEDRVALALSDPIRLQILDLVAAGRSAVSCSPANPDLPAGMCACDMLPRLSVTNTRLSYHLKELRAAGLIDEQKRSRWVYYTLNERALAQFIAALSNRFLNTEAEPTCQR